MCCIEAKARFLYFNYFFCFFGLFVILKNFFTRGAKNDGVRTKTIFIISLLFWVFIIVYAFFEKVTYFFENIIL